MDVSICILTYNEEINIRDCLESVLNQKNYSGNWEIIVVDGKSTDNTISIIEDMQNIHGSIKLITNKKRKIAPGRNLGVREARYSFIAFTDSDCIVPRNWLQKLSDEYEGLAERENIIAGVGGGNIPGNDGSKFCQALGVYLDTILGSFNSPQGRNFMAVTQVKSLACLNVLYNKDSIMEVGGFDEDMGNIGEDLDINIRLNANSFKLYFVPDIPVLHKLRPDFLSWLKNMALYGKGRAIVTFKHNLFCNYFFLLPLCFIIIMILTPLGVMNQLFFLSLLYFPIICGYTLVVTLKKNKSMLYFETLMIFILTHFVYSFNLLFHSLLILLLRLDRSIASHEKVEVS